MKKVAVLIFGQFREFEISIKSWKFLKLPFDFKIFMSTWNTTYHLQLDGSYSESEIVDLKRIENVVGLLTMHSISEEIVDNNGSMKKIIRHIKNCLTMMLAQKEIYDMVIMIRPDLWVDNRINFEKLILHPCPDNVVYTYGDLHKTDNGDNVIMDNMFICNMNTALKFLRCNPASYDVHKEFGQFFVDNNLTAQSFDEPFEIFIVRENCRNIPDINQDIVREKYYEWLIAHNRR